jgi:predicted methyltransferase
VSRILGVDYSTKAIDLVILDPPYSDDEAQELYGTPKLKPAAYTREAVRVLREGGWLVVYGDKTWPALSGWLDAPRSSGKWRGRAK